LWWLLEPKRAQAVDRWSGSMHHPNNSSQKHQTLMAFAHYTYEACQFHRLYVDLQSTPGLKKVGDKRGIPVDFLFDVGTHSNYDYSGHTGPGDFGREGIQRFVDQHQCLTICQSMDLVQLQPESDGEDHTRKKHKANHDMDDSQQDSDDENFDGDDN
ncbi:hypothetical protein K435DRAFT_889034, partial [Dendrothele bispora CBS 962.96]